MNGMTMLSSTFASDKIGNFNFKYPKAASFMSKFFKMFFMVSNLIHNGWRYILFLSTK